MERKFRAQSESIAFVLVVGAALVLVNVLGFFKIHKHWDLTDRQLFTLSEGTRRIFEGVTPANPAEPGLHDQLTITVYFTPNQPVPWGDDERTLRDQLDEYRQLAHGRVQVRYVTPDNDERKRQADTAGCTKGVVQAVSNEHGEALEAYRCVTFEYLGQRQKIEQLEMGAQGLEYEISSIVKSLIDHTLPNHRDRTIGFLGGHGEQTPEEGLQYLPQVTEHEREAVRTRTVNLSTGDMPTDIDGLIIANPTRRIEEAELRKLDAYLMHGGSIAVFASGLSFASVDPNSATGTAAEHHLNDWLDGYGIHLNGDVVLDPRSGDAMVPYHRQVVRVPVVTWPFIVAVQGNPSDRDLRDQGGLDPSFPATFRLPEIVTPYPSTITISGAAEHLPACPRAPTANSTPPASCVWVVGRSSPRSIDRTSDFDLNLREILSQGDQMFERAAHHGPYVVGAALQGRFRSAYADHPPAPPAAGAAAPPTVPDHAEHDARLLVLGSGQLFSLEALRMMPRESGFPINISLMLNTFDWLSQNTDLLAVRAKDTSDPPLRRDVSDKFRSFFKWGAIVGLPILIGALGLLLTSARRGRRKNYLAQYGTRTAGA